MFKVIAIFLVAACCTTPASGQADFANSTTEAAESSGTTADTSNLKCAESYCLPDNYDKLEVPFDDEGLVHVSVDFDTLQGPI